MMSRPWSRTQWVYGVSFSVMNFCAISSETIGSCDIQSAPLFFIEIASREIVEHQRFHRDGHGVRRQSNPAQVDVIKVHEHNAVDHQQLGLNTQVITQYTAEGLREIAIENQVEGLAACDRAHKSTHDAPGQRGD